MSRDLRDHPPFSLLSYNAIVALLNNAVEDEESGYFDVSRFNADGSISPINMRRDGEEIDEDDPEHIPTQAEIDTKVAPDVVRAFLSELEKGTIMTVSSTGMVDSSTTFGWAWHPRIGGGLLYNYCSDIPIGETQLEVLEEKTSPHFADRLAKLLVEQDYSPINFVGMRMALTLDGITADDFTDTMKRAVFAQEPSDPDPAASAAAWVRKCTAQEKGTKSKRRTRRR